MEVPVPRYFIDTTDGHLYAEDEEGSDLPDLQAAGREAVAALPEIAKGLIDRLPTEVSSIVRDEDGSVLFKATLRLSEEWLVNPSA